MNRRSFVAALFAPLLVRFLPRRRFPEYETLGVTPIDVFDRAEYRLGVAGEDLVIGKPVTFRSDGLLYHA